MNGVYWGAGLEVPAKVDVDYKSTYKPTFYGYKLDQKGKSPSHFLNVDVDDSPMKHYRPRKAKK